MATYVKTQLVAWYVVRQFFMVVTQCCKLSIGLHLSGCDYTLLHVTQLLHMLV